MHGKPRVGRGFFGFKEAQKAAAARQKIVRIRDNKNLLSPEGRGEKG